MVDESITPSHGYSIESGRWMSVELGLVGVDLLVVCIGLLAGFL